MSSTFSGIEIGKRGVQTHQKALEVVGHNLTNASTEGYSRQRITMQTVQPLSDPSAARELTTGQVGQGVEVRSIERVRDLFLEQRILTQTDNQAYWESRDQYIEMTSQVYNEIGEGSLRNLMDRFWKSWDELAVNPEDMGGRSIVQQHGEALIKGINNQFERLNGIRTMADDEIQVDVNTLNGYLDDIAALNIRISQAEAVGDIPNDLLDKRDLFVEKVAQYLPVSVEYSRDPDEFLLYTNGRHLVQGGVVSPLETEGNPDNEGFVDIRWKKSGDLVDLSGGKLASLVQVRDVDVRGEIQRLDTMTLNLTDSVNDIHRRAWSMNGQTNIDFFVERQGVLTIDGNLDTTGDGNFDSTYLSRITGTTLLEKEQQPGLQGVITLPGLNGDDLVEINYNATDRVQDILDRINNSQSEVTSTLNSEGRIVLKATSANDVNNPDFVIRHLQDSGLFLTQYAGVLQAPGIAGAYTSNQPNAVDRLTQGGDIQYSVGPVAHPSATFGLSDAVAGDITSIAAGYGDGIRDGATAGDNRAAHDIGKLRYNKIAVGEATTFVDYFADALADMGTRSDVANFTKDTFDGILKDLTDWRESISGVSIDEEVSEMLKYQHGYQASARFLNTYNQLLDTIINGLV